MVNPKTKLELTWIGKENQPRLPPRILIDDPAKSYGHLLACKNMKEAFAL
jgi:adenine-specific DNA-methyltransferase